jgi:TetR/AcrR family transcriptional regulator, ethionamide resistance regulator
VPSVVRARSTAASRRADAEERALRAVEALMEEGLSYTEMPVLRIAQEAGMARSTFYMHFADKTELLIRLGDRATDELFEVAEAWWRGDHSEGIPGVVRTMRAMISGFRRHERMLLALTEVAAYEPAVAAFWLQRVAGFVVIVEERLRELQAEGRVSASLDPSATAGVLTLMVERGISLHVRIDQGDGDLRLAEALGRAIWLTTYGDAPT